MTDTNSAVDVLPEGRTKQDVVNLVDLALGDALETPEPGTHIYNYDIFVAKLAGNGLAVVSLAELNRRPPDPVRAELVEALKAVSRLNSFRELNDLLPSVRALIARVEATP